MANGRRNVLDLHPQAGEGKDIKFLFFGVLLVLLVFLTVSSFQLHSTAAPSKSRIKKEVNKLNFLSSSLKQDLVLSIFTGARDGLLDYGGKIGTKAFLNILTDKDASQTNKLRLIRIYKKTLKKDLPVYLITETSIRLFRTGAPFDTVFSTVSAQVRLLGNISQYLERAGIDLYLTNEEKTLLIDALAESVVTFYRQDMTNEDRGITEDEIRKLKQTVENMVEFSSLPVSFGHGTKGGSTSGEANPQLKEFLKNEKTIKDLAEFANEFRPRR